MELLSRSLKIFLSLPHTTSGVRSLEVAESSPKAPGKLWCGSRGCVWVGSVGVEAHMNRKIAFCLFFIHFFRIESVQGISLFLKFILLTMHKLIRACCRFTLKHEAACWCKGKAIRLLVAMEAGAL